MAPVGTTESRYRAELKTGGVAVGVGVLVWAAVYGLGALIGPVSADAAFTAASGVGATAALAVGRFVWRQYYSPDA